jgi:Flp pilus assembly protein TadG
VAAARRRLDARSRTGRGAVAVELALVLPLLVALLLGIVTAGIALSRAIGLQNAVREGSRFGATADVSLSKDQWAGDVIARVRSTQFDDAAEDAASQTSICVQLVRLPSTVEVTRCSIGGRAGAPALSMPALSQTPAVPAVTSSTPPNTCVVRVLVARPFVMDIGLARRDSTMVRGSTARYERTC